MLINQIILCKLGNFERQIYRCYRRRTARGFCSGQRHSRTMYSVILGPLNTTLRYV